MNIFADGARPCRIVYLKKPKISWPNLTIILLTLLFLTKEGAILVIFLAPFSVICGLTKCHIDENT
jgi:hypothetical protein